MDKMIMFVVGCSLIIAMLFGQSNPILLYRIFTSEHPTLEASSILSSQYACNIFNPLMFVGNKIGGSIDIETLNITISPDLTEEEIKMITAHEECHKKQILEGRLNESILKDDTCFEIMMALEKECEYVTYGIG